MVRCVSVIVCLFALAGAPARAARVALDKPLRIAAETVDKTKLAGRIAAYDDAGFELLRGKDEKLTVRWAELDAQNLFAVRSALLADGTGAEWLKLGLDLLARRDGEALAEKAFARALRLEPRLQKRVDRARARHAAAAAEAAAAKPVDATAEGDGAEVPDAEAAGAAGGPQLVGQPSEETTWKALSEAEQADAVAEMEAFAADAATRLKLKLARYETKFFLFYTDIPERDAREWAGLLDRIYARLAGLFDVPRGRNVWRGKALVFVFAQQNDYRRFQMGMHDTDPGPSAGMCHAYPDGTVHIAFFRQGSRARFAHVLVHESVHGFVHRFRGPAYVPSWANEGLAEVIAGELVGRPDRPERTAKAAAQSLREHGGLRGLLDAEHLEGWQYPVAESLTTFMIRTNRRGFVNFIVGIKDGLPWPQGLEQKYKSSRAQLVKDYGKSMGIDDLKE